MFEWVKGPFVIHSLEDGIKDSFTTGSRSEGAHFADASAHFDKEPFDNVCGANAFPMLLRTIKEG